MSDPEISELMADPGRDSDGDGWSDLHERLYGYLYHAEYPSIEDRNRLLAVSFGTNTDSDGDEVNDLNERLWSDAAQRPYAPFDDAIEPAEGTPPSERTSYVEGLSPTLETQFTVELRELAKSLNYDPWAIYWWVANNIELQDYPLSRKGAEATFHTRSGNDWDQCSLLITLLRISGVPTYYTTADREVLTTYDLKISLSYMGYMRAPAVVLAYVPVGREWVRLGQVESGNTGWVWITLAPWKKQYQVQEREKIFEIDAETGQVTVPSGIAPSVQSLFNDYIWPQIDAAHDDAAFESRFAGGAVQFVKDRINGYLAAVGDRTVTAGGTGYRVSIAPWRDVSQPIYTLALEDVVGTRGSPLTAQAEVPVLRRAAATFDTGMPTMLGYWDFDDAPADPIFLLDKSYQSDEPDGPGSQGRYDTLYLKPRRGWGSGNAPDRIQPGIQGKVYHHESYMEFDPNSTNDGEILVIGCRGYWDATNQIEVQSSPDWVIQKYFASNFARNTYDLNREKTISIWVRPVDNGISGKKVLIASGGKNLTTIDIDTDPGEGEDLQKVCTTPFGIELERNSNTWTITVTTQQLNEQDVVVPDVVTFQKTFTGGEPGGDAWHHVVISFDGHADNPAWWSAGGWVQCFIDGAEVTSADQTIQASIIGFSTQLNDKFTVGGIFWGNPWDYDYPGEGQGQTPAYHRAFSGGIDEVAVYEHATRSAVDAKALMDVNIIGRPSTDNAAVPLASLAGRRWVCDTGYKAGLSAPNAVRLTLDREPIWLASANDSPVISAKIGLLSGTASNSHDREAADSVTQSLTWSGRQISALGADLLPVSDFRLGQLRESLSGESSRLRSLETLDAATRERVVGSTADLILQTMMMRDRQGFEGIADSLELAYSTRGGTMTGPMFLWTSDEALGSVSDAEIQSGVLAPLLAHPAWRVHARIDLPSFWIPRLGSPRVGFGAVWVYNESESAWEVKPQSNFADIMQFASQIVGATGSLEEARTPTHWSETGALSTIASIYESHRNGVGSRTFNAQVKESLSIYMSNGAVDSMKQFLTENPEGIVIAPLTPISLNGISDTNVYIGITDDSNLWAFDGFGGGRSDTSTIANTTTKKNSAVSNISAPLISSVNVGGVQIAPTRSVSLSERLTSWVGDPVDIVTGEFYLEELSDLSIKSRGMKLEIARRYGSQTIYKGPFGFGWGWSHAETLDFERDEYDAIVNVIYFDSSRKPHQVTWPGANDFGDFGDAMYPSGSKFRMLKETRGAETWIVVRNMQGNDIVFDESGVLREKRSPHKDSGQFVNVMVMQYDSATPALGDPIRAIIDPLDRRVELTYDAAGHIVAVTDFAGRKCEYGYQGDDLVWARDSEGHVTRYDYLVDQTANPLLNHNISKVTLPTGDFLELIYYPNDTVALHRNASGNEFHFQYSMVNQYAETWNEESYYKRVYWNANWDVTRIEERDGTVERSEYDSRHNLVAKTDRNGKTWQYGYDCRNRMVWQQDPEGSKTFYKWSVGSETVPENRVVESIDPNGVATQAIYTIAGDPEVVIQNGRTYAIDAEDGAYSMLVRPRAVHTGRPISAVVLYESTLYYNGEYAVEAVDCGSLLPSEIDPIGSDIYPSIASRIGINDSDGEITFHVDPLSHDGESVARIDVWVYGVINSFSYQSPNDNCIKVAVRPGLSGIGERSKEQVVFPPRRGAWGWSVATFTFDEPLEPADVEALELTLCLKATNGFAAAVAGILIDLHGVRHLDAQTGFPSWTATNQTDAKLRPAVRYAYDKFGNRTAMILDPADLGGGGQTDPEAFEATTTYVYDALGLNQLAVTNAEEETTRFEYDDLGRMVLSVDPEGYKQQIEYDKLDQVVRSVDQTGGVTTTEYDSLRRIARRVNPNGAETRTTYHPARDIVANDLVAMVTDPLGYVTSYEYDPRGNRTKMVDANGQAWQWTYDGMDRVVSQTDPLGGQTQYVYDGEGRVIQEIGPGGKIIKQSYDGAGRLASREVTVETGGAAFKSSTESSLGLSAGSLAVTRQEQVRRTEFVNDAAGRLIRQRTRLELDPQGNGSQYFWNVLRIDRDGLGREEERYEYTYSDVMGEPAEPWLVAHRTVDTRYDRLGRIAEKARKNGTGHGQYSTHWGYDLVGRRTSEFDTENIDETLLLEDGIWREVALGEVLSTQGYVQAEYDYNARGLLVSETRHDGTEVTYQYDGLGRRTGRQTQVANGAATVTHDEQWSYDAVGNMVYAAQLVDGHKTSELTRTFSLRGEMTSEVDALGNLTRYEYDGKGQLTRKTDARGYMTLLSYDGVGHLIARRLADGGMERFEYDVSGNLVGQVDANGYRTSLAYNEVGELVASRDPLGRVTEHQYDPRGNQVLTVDAEDDWTVRTFTGFGELASTVRWPDGASGSAVTVASRTYDDHGRVLTETDETGSQTKYFYDYADRVTGTVRAYGAADAYSERVVHDGLGRVVKVESGLTAGAELNPGQWTGTADLSTRQTMTYDTLGRVLTTAMDVYDGGGTGEVSDDDAWTAVDHSTTQTTYNDVNRWVTEQDRFGSQTIAERDALGRVVGTVDAAGVRSTWEYDAVRNVVRQSTQGAAQPATEMTYDAVGRLVSRKVGVEQTTYTYDLAGRVQTMTNALGKVTSYSYDVAGQLLSVTEDSGAGGIAALTQYGYDDLGRHVQVKSPKSGYPVVQQTKYDALGRVAKTWDDQEDEDTAYRREYGYATDATALSGLALWPNDGTWTGRHYAVTESRYDGNTLEDTVIRLYDRLHRLKAVVVDNQVKQYFAYDGQGRLKFSSNVNAAFGGGWSSVGMEYDVWGRLTHDRQSWQDPNGDKDWLSNPGGAVDAAMSYGDSTAESGMSGWQEVAAPAGPTYRLTFDDRRQVSKVTKIESGNPAAEWAKYGYEPGGELVREELPGAGGTLGNLWSRVEFDAQGRESRRRYVDVNTSRFEQSNGYDAVGNVVDRREVQTRDSALERQHLFEVDALNRVTKQADGTSSTPPSLGSSRYTWTFDAANNWLTTTQDTPGTTQSRTANAQNEYTAITSQTVAHDCRGNVTQHGDRKYEYDWDNRLIAVRDGSDVLVSKYAYDALGRLNCRLKYDEYGQPLPYEFLHYAGRGLMLTYTQGGAAQWFVTSPRTGYMVGMWVDGPDEGAEPDQFHAALHNSRGDVSALTYEGAISESYHYSAYGRRTTFSGSTTTAEPDSPLGNVIGLTGQISLGDNSGINCDPEGYFSSGTPRAGLWHMNARTYSPSLGRFVQRDPAGFVDGANLYVYARNDPWVYVDPEGLAARATWNATVSTAQTVGSAAKQAAVHTDQFGGQLVALPLTGSWIGHADASFVSLAGAAGAGLSEGVQNTGNRLTMIKEASTAPIEDVLNAWTEEAPVFKTKLFQDAVAPKNLYNPLLPVLEDHAKQFAATPVTVPYHLGSEIRLGFEEFAATGNTDRASNALIDTSFLFGTEALSLTGRPTGGRPTAEVTENAPVRGGESIAAARGRSAHEAFKEQVGQKPGWDPRPRLQGKNGETLIPDALDPKGRPVELKPNTPSGRAQGARQIEKYKEATGTNGRVIYYDP